MILLLQLACDLNFETLHLPLFIKGNIKVPGPLSELFCVVFSSRHGRKRVSEKEKKLAEALNEVRCFHVDTKIGGSVAKWLGLVLFSVVPGSGPRPRFKHS